MISAESERKPRSQTSCCRGGETSSPQGRPRGQRGFAIVAAIFILVVLAGLGAYLVSSSTTQHTTQMLDVMNARAHQASRTGIEWGIYQVVKGGAYRAGCDAGAGYAVPPAAPILSATLNGIAGLNEFCVVVGCDSAPFTEGAINYRVYQITSTACNAAACNAAACPSVAPGFGYVEHQQRTRVRMP